MKFLDYNSIRDNGVRAFNNDCYLLDEYECGKLIDYPKSPFGIITNFPIISPTKNIDISKHLIMVESFCGIRNAGYLDCFGEWGKLIRGFFKPVDYDPNAPRIGRVKYIKHADLKNFINFLKTNKVYRDNSGLMSSMSSMSSSINYRCTSPLNLTINRVEDMIDGFRAIEKYSRIDE